MPGTLITAPTFALLQRRLLADLRAAAATHPWSPHWVVVPSATLANHLRGQLARAAGDAVFANVRVVNLPQFADRLARELLGAETPAWGPALDLSLVELVAALPARSPLANLREIPGGALLLRQAFTDLAEGGFGPANLEHVEELAADPALNPREQSVLRLFAQWVRLLERRGLRWAPLVLQTLPDAIPNAADTLAAEAGQQPQVFVYGFYDWLDVHLDWLTTLARRVTVTFYYPTATGHTAFAFGAAVLADLRARLDDVAPQPVAAEPSPPAEFFLETFPEGPIPAQPAFLSCQRAAGARAEAIAAAVRIRRWLDDDGLRPEEIMVVAPRAEDYPEAVQDVFAAFAIPVRVSDVPAGPTPADEPLRMLARLWEEQAPAEWVLALLRFNPSAPIARQINLDRFERLVRELGLWGGAAWRVAADADQFDAAEKELIRSLLQFVPAPGAPPVTTLAPGAAGRLLRQMAADWLPDPTAVAPLLDAADALAQATPQLAVELRHWCRLLAECGGGKTLREPLTAAVHFVPVMRARGLTARGVVLLGLAAGEFPARVPPDPLLTEAGWTRLASLAEQIGHRLPLKARLPEEMLLLFFLLNTAAERVHWVVPETDAAGKAVAPTPWVQRYLQHWAAPDRLGRSPFAQGRYLAGLDPGTGRFLPPALARFVDQRLAPADAPTGELPEGCLGAMPQFRNDRVGVTSLEALARCPFQFYAKVVAGWEPLEALSLNHTLDALTRGILLHRLMELAVQPHLKKQPLSAIARATDRLAQLAQELPAREPAAAFPLALLPPVFQKAALRDLARMATAYFAAVEDDAAVPQASEAEFTQPWPDLPGVTVAGKVDRVDDRAGRMELTDYKSGKVPGDFSKAVRLGWQIQAALYPWLAGQPAALFRYAYLGGTEAELKEGAGAPAGEDLLRELTPLLRQGAFIPTSNQVLEELTGKSLPACRYCPFVSACRRFESGAPARFAEKFRQVAPARVAAIGAVVEKKKR